MEKNSTKPHIFEAFQFCLSLSFVIFILSFLIATFFLDKFSTFSIFLLYGLCGFLLRIDFLFYLSCFHDCGIFHDLSHIFTLPISLALIFLVYTYLGFLFLKKVNFSYDYKKYFLYAIFIIVWMVGSIYSVVPLVKHCREKDTNTSIKNCFSQVVEEIHRGRK